MCKKVIGIKCKIKVNDWFQAYEKYRNLEDGVKFFQAIFNSGGFMKKNHRHVESAAVIGVGARNYDSGTFYIESLIRQFTRKF